MSSPTTSAVLNVADLGLPINVPVKESISEIDNFYKQELFNPDQEEIETTDLVEFHEDDTREPDISQSQSKTNEFLI